MSRHAIRRLGQVWAVVTGCLLALIVVTHGSSHAAPTDNSYSVANSLERPAGVKGRVFFGSTFYIDKESANRRIVISGSADGTASFYVDDLLDAVVTRPDGTMVTTQIDDSNGCTAPHAIARAPVDISEYFGIGANKVQVTFRDACGGGYGNSDIWVTGSVTFPSPRPSLPFIDGGKFVAIIYDNSNKGLICTSGFSVQKNGIKYMVTAKHCFDGKSRVTIRQPT